MLGDVKLKALSPTHVRGLYKEKLQTLSPRTVKYIHVTLHKSLKQALNDGLIPRNATEAVKPPQVRREEIRPLTPEQVKMLLDAASDVGDRLEALYALAVHTGLRQGELLGLKWEDMDLESGSLHVKRTLTTARGGPRLAAPKTKGSQPPRQPDQGRRGRPQSPPGASAGRNRPGRLTVARERARVRLRDRHAARPARSHFAPFQAASQARKTAGEDLLPRPAAHVRDA